MFDVITASSVKDTSSWDAMPCGLIKKSTNYRQFCYIPDKSVLDSFGWQYGLEVGSSKDIKPGILQDRRKILQPGCETTSS